MARAADQTLDRVGRRERLAETIGQAEREDGERVGGEFLIVSSQEALRTN